MGAPIRVLIADDHPLVRDGITAVLATQPDLDVAGTAGTGEEAVRQVAELRPDVVLMDLQMPGAGGIAATAEITAAHPGVPVLVLTTYDTDADITAAIDAGASGYLLKQAGREELCAAIRTATQGGSALSPQVAAKVLARMRGQTSPDGGGLSAREMEVLTALARGRGNKQIAKALHLSEATVKTHLLHIYAKLGVADRTAAVTTALERGIIRIG
ncbi:response regulator transcription factor [Streptomyces sp. NPDC006393]|uniref:response regulator transcription factor n=1 Tax=Streptomyces sp. NPDC006393 TaxID=3156763 RepID=UPI0033EBA77C